MNSLELDLQRYNTLCYIAANANQVALQRKTRTADGGGGQSASSAAQTAQWVRLISRADPPAKSGDGQAVTASWILMMRWDANVKFGDTFSINGGKFEVVSVAQTNDYETLAMCELRGGGQSAAEQSAALTPGLADPFWAV